MRVRPSWRYLEELLRSTLATRYQVSSRAVEVGKMVHLGEGLSRHAYRAWASWGKGEGEFVLLRATQDFERDREPLWEREFRVLERLSQETLPFRVPAPVRRWKDEDGPVMVVTWVQGLPMTGTFRSLEPWERLGPLAAAVHALDPQLVDGLVPSAPSRRAHAQEHLLELDGLKGSEFADARAWAMENLPPEDAPAVLHGDLLGQNVLLNPLSPEQPPGLIDWEETRLGDPAYDLAILTRGVRRPFQVERGLERLLESYHRAGGREVTAAHIRIHELCLAAHWHREARQHPSQGHPPEHYRDQLVRVLRMARAGVG